MRWTVAATAGGIWFYDYKDLGDHIMMNVLPGAWLFPTIEEAIRLAGTAEKPVQFEFNGCVLAAHPGMSSNDVYAFWKLQR